MATSGRSRRLRVGWVLPVVLTAAACSSSGEGGAIAEVVGAKSTRVVASAAWNCGNMSYEQCEMVQAAIAFLGDNPGCYTDLINTALLSGNIRFEPGPSMGRAGENGEIFLRAATFESWQQVANTLAHEASHIAGLEHPIPYDVGYMCSGVT